MQIRASYGISGLRPHQPLFARSCLWGEGDTGRSPTLQDINLGHPIWWFPIIGDPNIDPDVLESVLWGPPINTPNFGKPHINPANLETY